MNALWKTHGNRMGTYENLWEPMGNMKAYENLWKAYEIPMETYATLWKPMKIDGTLWKPMEKQDFQAFHCILRGAERRGEILSVFTAYYAVQSAAAKFLSVPLHITRREAPRRKFQHFFLRIHILAADGASDN